MKSLHKTLTVIACLIIMASCQPKPLSEKVKSELINIATELEKGVSTGNNESWKKYMAEDAILINRDGKAYGKAEIVDEIKPLPAGKILDIKPIDVKIFANTNHSAVLTFNADEKLSIWGQTVDTQYPSVMYFEKRKEGWQMVLFTYFEKPVNPPAVYLAKELLSQFNGTYRVSDSLRMEVTAVDSALRFKKVGSTGEGATLYPINTEGRFFRKDAELEYIFTTDSAHHPIIRQRRNWIDLIYTKE